MTKRLLLVLSAVFLVAAPAYAQVLPGKAIKIIVSQVPKYVNQQVAIEGRTGRYVHDASITTGVYTLTDDYGDPIRIRTSKGTPVLGVTHKVTGTLIYDGTLKQYFLIEASREVLNKKPRDVKDSEVITPAVTKHAPAEPAPNPKPKAESDGRDWVIIAAGAGAVLLLVGIVWMIADSKKRKLELARRRAVPPLPPAPSPLPPLPPDEPNNGKTTHEVLTPSAWAILTVTNGPAKPEPFDVFDNSVVVGRDPGKGGIELPDPQNRNEFSRKQFTLLKTPSGAKLNDGSSNGTMVDGQLVKDSSAAVKNGSKIEFGGYTLEVTLIEPPGATVAPGTAARPPAAPETIAPSARGNTGPETLAPTGLLLTVLEGAPDDKGKSFPVLSTTTTIGRQEDQHVRLEDRSTSRQQAEVTKDGDAYWLVNKSDKFPTSVDGTATDSQKVKLEPGSKITFGETTLLFEAKS